MFQQQVKKEDVIDKDILKLKKEKLEQVFAIDMVLVQNKYEGLLSFKGPLEDQFDIFDKPDLFHVQEQGKKYLCFGGQQHAKIQHFYQKHLQDKKYAELELSAAVESSQLKEQKLVFTNFILFFIKQEEIKVIILDQMDSNQDQDQIQILFLKTQTPTPELTIEIYVKREWTFHLNKDDKNIQAVEEKEELKKLNEIFDKCKLQNIDHCEWFKIGKKKYVFTCEANKFPQALDPYNQNLYNYQLKEMIQKLQWNMIESFKFPENYNDPKFYKVNEFTCTETLYRTSFEFKYVAFKFMKTLTKRDPRLNEIQATIDIMNQELSQVNLATVIEIKKIYNKQIYQTVGSEFERMLQKHPLISGLNLVKHLFHGSRLSDPLNIFSFESGLDMRHNVILYCHNWIIIQLRRRIISKNACCYTRQTRCIV
ncbi:UNKNOWN [Stylonychia lemnae]|uniref:Uncharacterized protein n=1 Tax=Stylonychia lemnae TaxID=5949 RepID=A0A077ZQD4_STYLE|nr:UNKNOWN [Stylonychia lemnae]|eukprot:CDW71674.1 UNKNOWN [Stylonychia lemnae]